MIPKKKALAKIHFIDFVEEFESENQALVNLISLGEESKERVVKVIKERLYQYVEEISKELDEDYNKQVERMEEEQESKTSPDLPKPSSVQKRKYVKDEED
jgi:hypothetical protein